MDFRGGEVVAKINFNLSEFPSGYFVIWTVCTQCENTVNVKLNAGRETLFEANKNDGEKELKVIKQESRTLPSGNPELVIEVNGASSLQQSMVSGLIADDKAQRVGFVYDFCIESGNEDLFNDVYVNIVGWAKKG